MTEKFPLKYAEIAGRHYYNSTAEDVIESGVSALAVMPAVRAVLIAEIDRDAESMRSRYITHGVGQSLEYQRASLEADAALGDGAEANADRYPMLAASIGIDVDPLNGEKTTDVLGVARSVKAAENKWLAGGAAIRRIRLSAKAAIEAAQDVASAKAARASVEWPAA